MVWAYGSPEPGIVPYRWTEFPFRIDVIDPNPKPIPPEISSFTGSSHLLTGTVEWDTRDGDEGNIVWGDGSTGTLNPFTDNGSQSHEYADYGTYRVQLTVQNQYGSVSDEVSLVFAEPKPEPEPVVEILPTEGLAPLTVSVIAVVSGATQMSLDWGDETQTGTRDSVHGMAHRYENHGEYRAKISVYDDNVWRDYGFTINVLDPNPVLPPIARLAITPTEGEIPLSVLVSTLGSEGTEMQLDWGDDSPVLGPMNSVHGAIHFYEAVGHYTATLRVWNEEGTWTETTQSLRVLDPSQHSVLLRCHRSSDG